MIWVKIGCLLVAVAMLIAYINHLQTKIEMVENQNDRLMDEVAKQKLALQKQADNFTAVNEALTVLGKSDEARAKKLRQFDKKLAKMAKKNEALEQLLSQSVPDELVDSLRAFSGDSDGGDTGGDAPAGGAPDSGETVHSADTADSNK